MIKKNFLKNISHYKNKLGYTEQAIIDLNQSSLKSIPYLHVQQEVYSKEWSNVYKTLNTSFINHLNKKQLKILSLQKFLI